MPAIVSAKRICCDAMAGSCWIQDSSRWMAVEGEATSERQAVKARLEQEVDVRRLIAIPGSEASPNSKEKVVLAL
jgi:hypothetical protein